MKKKKDKITKKKVMPKPAAKKKAVRKFVKKISKPKVKKTLKVKRKKLAAKSKLLPGKVAKTPVIQGMLIGHVTHYFPHVNAAAIKIEAGTLRGGDTLYFKGHTTDFKQAIQSLQMDHRPIQVARPGDEVGIQVKDRVREHDEVYKL
jgi:putative protease